MNNVASDIMGELAPYIDEIRKMYQIVQPQEIYVSSMEQNYEHNSHDMTIEISSTVDEPSEFAELISGKVYFEFQNNIHALINNVLQKYGYKLNNLDIGADTFGVELQLTII